jgi:hypothetical protein
MGTVQVLGKNLFDILESDEAPHPNKGGERDGKRKRVEEGVEGRNIQRKVQLEDGTFVPVSVQFNPMESPRSSRKLFVSTVTRGPGVKMIGDYIVKGTIGQGSYGKVKLGVHRVSGEKHAIKILNKLKMEGQVPPSPSRNTLTDGVATGSG